MKRCHKVLFATALLVFLSGVRADVSEQWISIAVEAQHQAREAPDAADRSLAAVRKSIALALAGTPSSANGNGRGDPLAQRERRDAAVALAAFLVLESLYPEQREYLETRLALAFSHIPETPAKAEGAAEGRRIANKVLAPAR